MRDNFSSAAPHMRDEDDDYPESLVLYALSACAALTLLILAIVLGW